MPTIVFANPKGGVGKSTVAALLTEWLDHHGVAIKIVDGDPNQTFNTWSLYRAQEGRPLKQSSSVDCVTVVDTAGTSNSSITWLQKADVVITPFKPVFADLDLTVTWFQGLNEKLQKKVIFVPNMVGVASEHATGIDEIKKITKSVGAGTVLTPFFLKNRDAVYPEALKGLGTNFFSLGARYKDAQKEFESLARAITKACAIKIEKA
jgi:hypothetical protein